MTIHKGNIEAYLLDYIEGNLDALLTAELMAFLSENPEYEKWIPEYDGHICLESGPVYENKIFLKKNFSDIPQIDEHNFDEFCIASGEGLLEGKDQARLDEYLELHPEKQQVFDVYGTLRLQPDYLLVYPDKKDLKKHEPVVIPLRFLYYAIGVAASIALVVMLVSRKPAAEVFTGNAPAKSAIRPTEMPVTVPGNPVPAVSPGKLISTPVAGKAIVADVAVEEPEPALENTPDLQPPVAIEPIRIAGLRAKNREPEIRGVLHPAGAPVIYTETPEMASAAPETPIRIIGAVVKKLNLWKAAESAVTGFNYLTEARLSLVRTTDENGNFSSLSIESEDDFNSGNKVK